jgi:hypothetical protein
VTLSSEERSIKYPHNECNSLSVVWSRYRPWREERKWFDHTRGRTEACVHMLTGKGNMLQMILAEQAIDIV